MSDPGDSERLDSERGDLGEAVDLIAAAATPAGAVVAAPRFADPLVDVFSAAAAVVGGRVRVPDGEVERDLPPVDAVAAASGLMIYPAARNRDWWRDIAGPAVASAGDEDEPVAVLPGGRGAWLVRPGERILRRVRNRDTPPRTPASVLVGELPPDASWRGLIWWSLRRKRNTLGQLLLLAAVGGLTSLLLPLATAALFSYAIPQGHLSVVTAILIAFAAGNVGAGFLLLARNLLVIKLRDHSDQALGAGVAAHALRLPVPFFRHRQTGDTMNRLLSISEARVQIDDTVPSLVITSMFGIVNLFVLLAINAVLALLVTLVVLVVIVATVWAQVRARAALTCLLQAQGEADATLMAMGEAIVPIRVSGAEDRAFARWARKQVSVVEATDVRERRVSLPEPLLAVAPMLVQAILILSVIVVSDEVLTLGNFLPAYAAVAQLTVAMGMVATNLLRLSELGPMLSRLTPITTTPTERPDTSRACGPLTGAVALKDVVFGYESDEPPLLDGLDLTIEPGEFVAVVGPSGSGKSTVLRLLLGFEDPWNGVVTFDGMDLAELDVQSVRRQIGTVLQSSIPYGATVRDAVCGPLVLADDSLWDVLAEAGVAADVRSMPDGLDTVVGDRGGHLSGGQRQRLMIARALAGRPRMLLLDEATSALDNLTQDVVMRTILRQPVTRIVVAHRLSTIERADRVVVVAGGRIVESGPPDVLLRSDGHFARLAARQEF